MNYPAPSDPAGSPIWQSLVVAAMRAGSCILEWRSPDTFAPGVELDVRIRLLFPWMAQEFRRLRTVRLYEGSKLVATGEFLDQSDDDHQPGQPG